jgi:chitinase
MIQKTVLHITMLAVCLFTIYSFNTLAQQRSKPVIIGYVGGYNGNIIATEQIEAKRLSHINYAFVDIKANRAWLHNEKTDTSIFANWLN